MVKLTLELPTEFLELCRNDVTDPEIVLKNFIADLCSIENSPSDPRTDGYGSTGPEPRRLARWYYARVGYPFSERRPK